MIPAGREFSKYWEGSDFLQSERKIRVDRKVGESD